jgi:uncharacterized membrane protein
MRALELLSAPGLWLLAGLAPIVALYVLKIRREPVRVSSSWLWAAAQRDLLAKHPWRRFTRELPLLLEVLALAALAVALARPATRGGGIRGDHVAIVIDTSASMLTAEKGGTRIEQAKALARDAAAHLSAGADAFVIDAGPHADAITPLQRDRRALTEAIGRVEARAVEGDLGAAVGLAADRLRSLGGTRRILLFTDGALPDGPPILTGGIETEVVRVGETSENAGIVRIDARRGVDPASRRDEVQVFAMLESFGDRPRDGYVTLTIDGRPEPVASRRVTLAPHEKTPVTLTFEPRAEDEGAGLAVRLAPADALAADDVAYARVPGGRSMPVVLATDRPRSWLGRALAADADVDLRTLTLAELATVNVDPDALVVVDGACPALVPGRDVLVASPGEGECLGVHVGAEVDAPRVTSWDTADPRLRFLSLDGVHVVRSRALDVRGAQALVRAASTTLVADASTPGRTATLVAFDIGDSDWPVQASFVLFVRDVVEVARAHRAQGASVPARTGEPIRLAVPGGITHVVEEQGGVGTDVQVKGGFVVLPPIPRAGIVLVRWFEPHVGKVVLPVNLTSECESDVRPRDVKIEAGTVTSAGSSRAPDAHQHHEWAAWLALLATIVLAFEVTWLTRTGGVRRAESRAWLRVIAWISCVPLVYEGLVRAGALSDRYLRFGSPLALVGVAAAGCLLAWRFGHLSPRMGRVRRAVFIAVSSMSVLAAALAVAEPELGLSLDRMAVLVAVDRSRSIDLVPGAGTRIAADLAIAEKSMRSGDRIGTVVFGAEAATEDPPRPRSELAPPQRIEVGRDGTDIEAAIRRALAEIPADTSARVVLETDGVETRGDALAAAAAALAAGVPVDTVMLEQKRARDVRVVTVGAPAKADRDEPFDLRVVTSSSVETDVEVRVSRDGVPLAKVGRTHVTVGEDVLRLRQIAPDTGLHRYDVAITALDPSADSSPEDNAGTAFVRVRGPSIALVLDGDDAGAPLAHALESAGFLVENRSIAGAPADVGELAAYDLVTLSDIRATDLSTAQIDALAAYVRDLGGGLLLMGGDRAMGPGGYARTPIEDVSPVSFDLKKEKRRASLAEVIAIDYSGSMGMVVSGRTKLSLANEAAARSASLLGHGDRLAVEHVDTEVRWTVPLGPVDDPDAIAARIRSVSVGGGGIYTDIALQAGYDVLGRESVNLKHVLLFADGDDAEQIAGCRAIVHGAAKQGITTSVISLGRGHDSPELEALSKEGGGRFYLIDDATKLPAVFTQETILAAKSAIHEDPFRASLAAPSPATRAVSFDDAPALGGYVVTVPKPRATVALTGPDGDPILATWSAGLGRAGAFMSDYRDRWGAAWLGWEGATRSFGQLARDLARKEGDARVRLESDASGGELHVRADVIGDDGRAQTFRRLRVLVAGPEGFSRDLPLEAVGAGRYAANLPLSRPGTYVATAKDESDGSAVGTTAAVLDRGEELRPTGSDRALLVRIASMTGGKMRDTLAGAFDDRTARRFSYAPLAQWLSLLAGVSLVLAVAARKMALPDGFAAVLGASTRPVLAARPAVRTSVSFGAPSQAAHVPTASPSTVTVRDRGALRDRGREGEPPRDSKRPLTSAEVLAKKRRQRR